MQATSTGDRTEECTDDLTDNPSPPNKKQKVAKDVIHVDRPELLEANLKGGVNENKRKMSDEAVVVYQRVQAASTFRDDAVVVHMPGEAASRLRPPAQPASKLRDDAMVVNPPGRPASKLKWRGKKASKKNPASKEVKKVIAPHQPCNDHEREEAKKRGKFFGYLNFPSGRKTKMSAASLPVETIETITADVTPPRVDVSQTSRCSYTNYETGLSLSLVLVTVTR